MAKKEMSFHIHKASIDDRIEQMHNKPGDAFKEENKKSDLQPVDEFFLGEMARKLEILSLELNKVNFINEELIIENELWKEQYVKLQEYMKSKEGGVINAHDVYQKNFITTINDLEKDLEQKETKITNIMKNIKSFEKENAGLKKEFETKQQTQNSSPTFKKDLMRKLEDLEKMNFHLNNELDQALYDKRKNIIHKNAILSNK